MLAGTKRRHVRRCPVLLKSFSLQSSFNLRWCEAQLLFALKQVALTYQEHCKKAVLFDTLNMVR